MYLWNMFNPFWGKNFVVVSQINRQFIGLIRFYIGDVLGICRCRTSNTYSIAAEAKILRQIPYLLHNF